jgi:hypothetical protein
MPMMLHCVHTTVHAVWRDVDRERELNTCWEQSMMGGVSEVTVPIDGRMEPAKTRGDGSPMLPQSREHRFRSRPPNHGTRRQTASTARGSRKQALPISLSPVAGKGRRPAMRGKRSAQLEMAKRHTENLLIFCSVRILMNQWSCQFSKGFLHLSERDVSKKCATPHRCCLMDTRSIIRTCLPFAFSAALDQNELRIIVGCNCKSRRMICSALMSPETFCSQEECLTGWCKFR